MRATVAQIQRCKPDLGLPGSAEETLTVFAVVNQLQILLQDLEKVRPSLPPSVPVVSVFFWFLFSELLTFFSCGSVESPGAVHPAAPESGPVQSSDSGADEVFSSRLRILPPGG